MPQSLFDATHNNATIDELQTLLAKAHDEQDNRKRRVAFNLVCALCHHLRQALLPDVEPNKKQKQMQVAVLHARISAHYHLAQTFHPGSPLFVGHCREVIDLSQTILNGGRLQSQHQQYLIDACTWMAAHRVPVPAHSPTAYWYNLAVDVCTDKIQRISLFIARADLRLSVSSPSRDDVMYAFRDINQAKSLANAQLHGSSFHQSRVLRQSIDQLDKLFDKATQCNELLKSPSLGTMWQRGCKI